MPVNLDKTKVMLFNTTQVLVMRSEPKNFFGEKDGTLSYSYLSFLTRGYVCSTFS